MFKRPLNSLLSLVIVGASTYAIQAQGISNNTTGGQIINTVSTAVPFLRIPPDARSGAMGDVGIAISPDANSMFFNPAKVVFNDKPLGLSVTYTPWLRELVNDIYLAHLGAYYKLDNLQAISGSVRYFSLGTITFTDVNGNKLQDFRPNEFAIDAGYSRKLSEDHLSVGVALRFIYSNLATGQTVSGVNIKPGTSAAGDVSVYYQTHVDVSKKDAIIAAGLAITNVGAKITYTESAQKDFLPTNLGLGGAFIMNLDDYNQLSFAVDLNKLLVPTPIPDSLIGVDGRVDPRTESPVAGMINSFADAPGGGREELNEIMYSVGAEYWYNKQFAVRAGYFYEAPTKGARQFFSAGLGLKYSVFGLNFSYLVPTTSQRHPLDNTLRFSLLFDFDAFKAQNEDKPKTM